MNATKSKLRELNTAWCQSVTTLFLQDAHPDALSQSGYMHTSDFYGLGSSY